MHALNGNDFVTIKGVVRSDLDAIFDVSREMEKTVKARIRTDLLRDKVLGLMFFQVSTRTRISFESAMARLGGASVGFADPKTTRSGDYYAESLEDAVRMMEGYSDVVVIRHPEDGAPARAAEVCEVPVVNAGDGYNEHPTQTLLDLYTILRERGTIEGVRVGVVGDMNIRVFHSLPLALAQYRAKLYFISPAENVMPEKWLGEFRQVGLEYEEARGIDDVIGDLDVLYMVGVQSPSFHIGRADAPEKRPPIPSEFVLDSEKLARAKPDMIVLHPLPRTSEVPVYLDAHPASRYFVQANYGVPVRMALLALLLGRWP